MRIKDGTDLKIWGNMGEVLHKFERGPRGPEGQNCEVLNILKRGPVGQNNENSDNLKRGTKLGNKVDTKNTLGGGKLDFGGGVKGVKEKLRRESKKDLDDPTPAPSTRLRVDRWSESK